MPACALLVDEANMAARSRLGRPTDGFEFSSRFDGGGNLWCAVHDERERTGIHSGVEEEPLETLKRENNRFPFEKPQAP